MILIDLICKYQLHAVDSAGGMKIQIHLTEFSLHTMAALKGHLSFIKQFYRISKLG